MTNNPFVELSVDRLNDCTFLGDMNAKLAEAVQSIHDYRAKYKNNAKTVKAVLTVQVEIIAEPREPQPGQAKNQAGWLIQTHINVKRPKDHPGQSMPVCMNGQDGQPKLFVQRAGSFDGDPTQLRLATEDGRGINPETHEISPDHTLEIKSVPANVGT